MTSTQGTASPDTYAVPMAPPKDAYDTVRWVQGQFPDYRHLLSILPEAVREAGENPDDAEDGTFWMWVELLHDLNDNPSLAGELDGSIQTALIKWKEHTRRSVDEEGPREPAEQRKGPLTWSIPEDAVQLPVGEIRDLQEGRFLDGFISSGGVTKEELERVFGVKGHDDARFLLLQLVKGVEDPSHFPLLPPGALEIYNTYVNWHSSAVVAGSSLIDQARVQPDAGEAPSSRRGRGRKASSPAGRQDRQEQAPPTELPTGASPAAEQQPRVTAELVEVTVSDLRPNPFRPPECARLNKQKVESIRESLRGTFYWPNIIGRRRDGHIEIAYGHHRLEALIKERGADYCIQVIVRDLTDDEMVKMLVYENKSQWTTKFSDQVLNVKAVIEAYGRGQIQLPEVTRQSKGADIRFAPRATPGSPTESVGDRRYTTTTLAQFLGTYTRPTGTSKGKNPIRPTDRLRKVLSALELIEQEVLSVAEIEEIEDDAKAEAMVVETMRTRRKALKEETAESASTSRGATADDSVSHGAGHGEASRGDGAEAPSTGKKKSGGKSANGGATSTADAANEKARRSATAAKAKAKEEGSTAKETGRAARQAAGGADSGAPSSGPGAHNGPGAAESRSPTAGEEVSSVGTDSDPNLPATDDLILGVKNSLDHLLDPDRDKQLVPLLKTLKADRGELSSEARNSLVCVLKGLAGRALKWSQTFLTQEDLDAQKARAQRGGRQAAHEV